MMAAPAQSDGHRLSTLLADLSLVDSAHDIVVSGLTLDSRSTAPGDLFLACRGSRQNGWQFIDEAIRSGAVAVVVEAEGIPLLSKKSQPVLPVAGLREKAGIIADRFFGHPSGDLTVIGVTGTNGKTSVSHFLGEVLGGKYAADRRCGVIGTLGYGLYGDLHPGINTTPDPVTLHQLLAGMVDRDVRYAVLEVSSHGLDQGRVNGIAFDVAVLTNLSRDHLDYHGDMTRYAKAKSQLFETISLKHAVCNSDDEFGRAIVDSLPAQVNPVTYGLDGFVSHAKRTRRPRVLGRLRSGNRLGVAIDVFTPWGDGLLETDLIGQFNAYNLLAALAAVCTIGVPFDVALTRLSAAPSLPGRMERFGKADGQPLVVVDYAHTPEALQQVLKSVRALCVGRLWCVFGCGGDRDPGKRPMMGAAAEAYADDIVLTSDNPRNEDPDVIIDDILTGVRDKARVRIQPDRARAIGEVLNALKAGDIVVVAGKGHEAYQEIGSERRPFSDRDLIQSLLRGME